VIYTQSIRRFLEDSAPGRSREYFLVLAVATVQSFLWAMMIPVTPLLARSLKATEVQVGFISIMPALIAIVFSLPGGALVTKFGKRAAFIGCGWFTIVGGVLFLLAKDIPGMILPQLFYGASNMLFWPTEKTYLTELIPEKVRAKVVGYSMAITTGGAILGPVCAGRLIDTVGFGAVFYTVIVLGVIGVIVAMPLPKRDADKTVSILSTFTEGISQVGTLLSKPLIRVTTLTTFTQYINSAAVEYFLPVYLSGVGFSATLIGTTVTLRTVGTMVVRLMVGGMAKRMNMVTLLFIALGVSAVAVGLVPLLPTVGYALFASFLMGFAFGIAPVLTAAVVAANTEAADRNIAMSLDSTSMYASRAITGSSVGALAGVVGYGPAIAAANGVILVIMVGLVTLYTKTALPRREASAAAGPGGC
jgi:MFS family permease